LYGQLCFDVSFHHLYRNQWAVILQAAASMVVNVGSFSDPEGLEGLAHFLGAYAFLLYDDYFIFF
jgi:predicted Zn-dependent peptidase